ncbi:MAG: hypothetical protein HYU39_04705 [Thaumarchaeota archaeon]|nr:hypothetical protein [Nitrososphaerota archaeon]
METTHLSIIPDPAEDKNQRSLVLNERQKKEIRALSDATYEALIALAQRLGTKTEHRERNDRKCWRKT